VSDNNDLDLIDLVRITFEGESRGSFAFVAVTG
jgi:hypothetical protein